MTPDELAKAGTEHAEQKALFAWANCAALFGFDWADEDAAYDTKTRGLLAFSGKPSKPVPVLKRLFAIHNQGHGDKIRGARAKAEGVKSGVPDLMLPVPILFYNGFRCPGLFIELKKQKRGVISSDQADWLGFLQTNGYRALVCYGWKDAANAIKNYINVG